jgi:DegV family protein with EDD domain
MAVRVVTDSTAYLSPGLVHELGITVVPFRVQIDGETYFDGIDLDEDTFNRLVYKEGKMPTTSSPTVDDFSRAYDELNQETGEIIVILMSGTLSQACDHARQAADMFLGRCQIEVIDSKTVSVGLGILVEAAARAATRGRPLDEIVRIVRGIVPQIYVVFFSDTLTYLENGGRIGHAQALLGTILGIKPFLTLEDGEIMPIEKVRTREQALEKLLEFVIEFDSIRQLAIVKGTSEPDEETDLIVDRLHAVFPNIGVPVLSYGPVLASHIGPDTMGIIVYESYDT